MVEQVAKEAKLGLPGLDIINIFLDRHLKGHILHWVWCGAISWRLIFISR
jgi:hypothetical protein